MGPYPASRRCRRLGGDGCHPAIDAHSPSSLSAGHVSVPEYHDSAAYPDHQHLHHALPGIRHLPHRAFGHHPFPPLPERGLHQAHPAQRGDRAHGRGEGDLLLRAVRRGRELCGGHRDLRDPGGHQFYRYHQGSQQGGRGIGPFHPGRHAREADGHRCGSQRRVHQRGGGPQAPRGDLPGIRFLRRHGRCQQVRAGRCDRRHRHHLCQHLRGLHYRGDAAGDEPNGSRPELYHPDHRRRAGQPDSGPDHLHVRRYSGFPDRRDLGHWLGAVQAADLQASRHLGGFRHPSALRPHPGASLPALSLSLPGAGFFGLLSYPQPEACQRNG